MENFKIEDSENGNTPFLQTHYYRWLEEKKPKDIHAVNTKIEYLTEKGFLVGVNSINEADLRILKSIEQMYFYFEIQPNL